jgi:hypothetical protein
MRQHMIEYASAGGPGLQDISLAALKAAAVGYFVGHSSSN